MTTPKPTLREAFGAVKQAMDGCGMGCACDMYTFPALRAAIDAAEKQSLELERELQELRADKARLDLADEMLLEGWELDDWRPRLPLVQFLRHTKASEDDPERTPGGTNLREAIDSALALRASWESGKGD